MAAVKNVLKHVSTEVAGKRRRCYRKQTHAIVKGETCLVVRDGPQNQTTYCAVCASEILAKAGELLAGLQGQFERPHNTDVSTLEGTAPSTFDGAGSSEGDES